MDKENLNGPKIMLLCFYEMPQFPTCSKLYSFRTPNTTQHSLNSPVKWRKARREQTSGQRFKWGDVGPSGNSIQELGKFYWISAELLAWDTISCDRHWIEVAKPKPTETRPDQKRSLWSNQIQPRSCPEIGFFWFIMIVRSPSNQKQNEFRTHWGASDQKKLFQEWFQQLVGNVGQEFRTMCLEWAMWRLC